MDVININHTEIVKLERHNKIVDKVMREFAKRLDITPFEIREYNKKPHISDIRYLYCKLRHDMHGVTFKDVGRELGRSHSTVWYGVQRINNLLDYKDKNTVALWSKVRDIGELL